MAPLWAPFFMPPLAAKTFTTALRARKCISPLVAGATTFPPRGAVGLWVLSHVAMSLQESIERFILPPEQGEVRRSRIGGCARHGCNLMGESP